MRRATASLLFFVIGCASTVEKPVAIAPPPTTSPVIATTNPVPLAAPTASTEAAAPIAQSKVVRILSEPAGATVTIDGQELPRDSTGASSIELAFSPAEDANHHKTYLALASKRTDDGDYEPTQIRIAWDDGQTNYPVRLKEIRTRVVPLTTAMLQTDSVGKWSVTPRRVNTIATKIITERAGRDAPQQITRPARGVTIDSLAVSPDGAKILFTVLLASGKEDLRSQMLLAPSDGSGGAEVFSDGKTLDLAPIFTPDGSKIVFASTRSGRRLSLWSISASGLPGASQLTVGDSSDLFPSPDSTNQHRIFYQSMSDGRAEPQLLVTKIGSVNHFPLTPQAGSQPRVSPQGDSIVFAAADAKTAKRDLFRISDAGGTPVNLTNTPDADDFDPAWNKDGTRIAFTSDRGVDEDKRSNCDIWMINLARSDRPTQITTNGSRDDLPTWDPAGDAIYFRSNRGGEWAIWKITAN